MRLDLHRVIRLIIKEVIKGFGLSFIIVSQNHQMWEYMIFRLVLLTPHTTQQLQPIIHHSLLVIYCTACKKKKIMQQQISVFGGPRQKINIKKIKYTKSPQTKYPDNRIALHSLICFYTMNKTQLYNTKLHNCWSDLGQFLSLCPLISVWPPLVSSSLLGFCYFPHFVFPTGP